MKGFKRVVLATVVALFITVIPPVTFAFEFSLFGSTTFSNGDDHQENFALGELELIAEHNLSDKTYIVTDLLFESELNEIEIELERFSINRKIKELFEIGVGRYMQPLGFWNHNFSHGSLAQHTITRPLIIDVEHRDSLITPTHLVGLLMRGENNRFSYQLAIANADGMETEAAASSTGPATAHALNNQVPSNDLTTILRMTYRVTQRFEIGLLYGNHNYVEIEDGTTLVEEGEVAFEQTITAFDFNYNGSSYYLFGEFYLFDYEDNDDLSGGTSPVFNNNPDSYDAEYYYLQAGYHITENMTFVGRYESLDFDDDATFFAVQNLVPETRTVAGINFALEPSNNLRIQITEVDPDVGTGDTITQVQWYFYLL